MKLVRQQGGEGGPTTGVHGVGQELASPLPHHQQLQIRVGQLHTPDGSRAVCHTLQHRRVGARCGVLPGAVGRALHLLQVPTGQHLLAAAGRGGGRVMLALLAFDGAQQIEGVRVVDVDFAIHGRQHDAGLVPDPAGVRDPRRPMVQCPFTVEVPWVPDLGCPVPGESIVLASLTVHQQLGDHVRVCIRIPRARGRLGGDVFHACLIRHLSVALKQQVRAELTPVHVSIGVDVDAQEPVPQLVIRHSSPHDRLECLKELLFIQRAAPVCVCVVEDPLEDFKVLQLNPPLKALPLLAGYH
mmetsp:Transcript_141753/g.247115  ORF Transcript_141753/g.247115 Transcript_141753/m.247115 type:complete len:299 (+) Transcript_141753:1452-2348(+)